MKKTMKTITVAAIAAVSATAMSLPVVASAQSYTVVRFETRNDHRDQQRHVDRRIYNLQDRIDHSRRAGRLSRSEATRLNRELASIKTLSQRFERSGRGYDRQELATLDKRLTALESRLRWERQDRRDYGYRR